MNASRISRYPRTCRRRNRVRRRGGPNRRGRVRRLALGRAGRAPLDHPSRPAGAFCDALDSEHVAARRAHRRRNPKGAAGLRGRSFRGRAQYAPRHSRRAERRHLLGGDRSGARARLSPRRSWRRSGARRGLRRGLAAAVWECVLPLRAGAAVRLCRDAGLRGALSLSQRRDEGLRPRRDDCEPAERRGTLDARPRFLAR